jgi:hypothetical protein
MTITQGGLVNKLTLHPPAKSILDLEEPLWVLHDDEDFSYYTTMQPIFLIV